MAISTFKLSIVMSLMLFDFLYGGYDLVEYLISNIQQLIFIFSFFIFKPLFLVDGDVFSRSPKAHYLTHFFLSLCIPLLVSGFKTIPLEWGLFIAAFFVINMVGFYLHYMRVKTIHLLEFAVNIFVVVTMVYLYINTDPSVYRTSESFTYINYLFQIVNLGLLTLGGMKDCDFDDLVDDYTSTIGSSVSYSYPIALCIAVGILLRNILFLEICGAAIILYYGYALYAGTMNFGSPLLDMNGNPITDKYKFTDPVMDTYKFLINLNNGSKFSTSPDTCGSYTDSNYYIPQEGTYYIYHMYNASYWNAFFTSFMCCQQSMRVEEYIIEYSNINLFTRSKVIQNYYKRNGYSACSRYYMRKYYSVPNGDFVCFAYTNDGLLNSIDYCSKLRY